MASDAPLVLVVEDDEVIRRITCAGLSAGQFQVIEAGTGQKALTEVSAQHPDVILLDLDLPDVSGLDVIRQLGNSPHPPIVVFSAGSFHHDIVTAIEAGAVEYVAKPFVIGELLARLRTVLHGPRELQIESTSHFTLGDIEIDLLSGRVTLGDRELILSGLELRLFAALVRNSGRLLTYQFLIRELWEPDESPDYSALMSVVTQLRHKLEPDPVRPRYLCTEMGIGYRFCGDLTSAYCSATIKE